MKYSQVTVTAVNPNPKPTPPKTFNIVLNLTEDDASALLAATWYMGGDPATSFRGVIDEIRNDLLDAGLVNRGDRWVPQDTSGINFKNR